MLQHPPRRPQPRAGEAVVGGEVFEAVPVVVDAVDLAVIRPPQLAFELQIVGRVGEDHIDAGFGQARHLGNAVADNDAVRLDQGRFNHAGQDERPGDFGVKCGRKDSPPQLDFPHFMRRSRESR